MFSESEIPVLMLCQHKKSFNGSVIHNDWSDQLVHSIFIDLPLSKCWNPSTLNAFALNFKHVPFYHLVLMDFFSWSQIPPGHVSVSGASLCLVTRWAQRASPPLPSLHFKHSIYFLYEMDLVDWIIFTVGGSLWAWNEMKSQINPEREQRC